MRWVVGLSVLTTAATLAMHPSASASTTGFCDGTHPFDDHVVVGADGATDATNTNLDGVSGDIYVPNWTTANLRGQATSVADVIFSIQDSAGHYFQLGWYLGEAGDLEPASTPRVFFAEGTITPFQETLTTIQVPLTLNRYHNFRLQRLADADPYWNSRYAAFFDNSQVWTSRMKSTIEGTPGVVGETNWRCADLYERASTSLGLPTLKAHRAGGSWSLWQQHLDVYLFAAETTPECWYVGRIDGHTATSIAYDLC